MPSLGELLNQSNTNTGQTPEGLQALFQETFAIDPLPAEQQGSIVYLVGRVEGRSIKINAIQSGLIVDWVVNGINALRTGPLGWQLEKRQELLLGAVARVPMSPEPEPEPEPA